MLSKEADARFGLFALADIHDGKHAGGLPFIDDVTAPDFDRDLFAIDVFKPYLISSRLG